MPRQLILLACYGFIVWLIRKDMAWRSIGSRALLIPGIWIAVQGSRPVSYWLGGGGGESGLVNTIWFAAFLLISVTLLMKRQINWGAIFRSNKALFLMYGYLLCSITWSESPGDSLKRLVKDFECVPVALVFLSGRNAPHAIRAIYVRVAYILFPLSVVFIKYFPEIGRSFSRAGEAMFGGVTTQKNSLGETIFVFSLFVVWDLVLLLGGEKRPGRTAQVWIRIGILVMGLWLLEMCDSQTSFLCLLIGAGIYWGCGRLLKMAHGKRWLMTILIGMIVTIALDKTLNLSDTIIRALGRDPSLTGRTDIWRLVLEQQDSPWLGNGYFIFWDSQAGMAVIESFMQINSAHNGFLEMYLDGGLLGATLLVMFLIVTGKRVIDRTFAGHPLGRMGLVFWLLAILYNFSESSFLRLDVLWFTLLLLAIECGTQLAPARIVSPQA